MPAGIINVGPDDFDVRSIGDEVQTGKYVFLESLNVSLVSANVHSHAPNLVPAAMEMTLSVAGKNILLLNVSLDGAHNSKFVLHSDEVSISEGDYLSMTCFFTREQSHGKSQGQNHG